MSSTLYRPGPCQNCGEPGRRYVNAHWCDTCGPTIPTPDPALTLAGLRKAAGINVADLPERMGSKASLRKRLDTAGPLDANLGTIEDDGPYAIWRCGLCAVSGSTSPKSARLALESHLRYRHPNRAEKVAERLAGDAVAPVVGQ